MRLEPLPRGNCLNSRRKQLVKMWKQDPHCRQCGRLTVLSVYKNHKAIPDNTATLEHVFSRLNPLRLLKTPGVKRRTLLCRACNQTNGLKEQKALGIEELRRRSRLKKPKGIFVNGV